MRATRFAIGTSSSVQGETFAGQVLGNRVTALDRHLGPGTSVRSLLEDWPRGLPALQSLADRLSVDDCEHRLDQLAPLPPVQPGKHGMGEQTYLYFREPGGILLEVNSSGYRNSQPDWEPVHWVPSQGSNTMFATCRCPIR